MPRPPSGQIVERKGKRGRVYALRFRAYGQRRYVTTTAQTRTEAEAELERTLAAVKLGIWRPPEAAPTVEQPTPEPMFHEFASEWFAAGEAEGLAAKTLVDLRWSLSNHLSPTSPATG
jgi:hypothetical protein